MIYLNFISSKLTLLDSRTRMKDIEVAKRTVAEERQEQK